MSILDPAFVGAAVGSFRRTWPRLALTALVYKLLGFVLLAPLSALVLRAFLWLSGREVVADEQIAAFFLSPVGMSALIVVGSIGLAILALEQAAAMTIVFGDANDQRIGVLGALRFAFGHARPTLELTGRMLVRTILIAAPFMAAAAAIVLWKLSEYDINFYLTEKPPEFWLAAALVGLLVTALGVVLVPRVLSWSYALPLVVFAGKSPAAALRQSHHLTRASKRTIAISLLGWGLASIVASSVLLGLTTGLARLVIPPLTQRMTLLLVAMGTLLLLWALANLAVTLGSEVAFAVLIVRLYLAGGGSRELPSDWSMASKERELASRIYSRRTLGWAAVVAVLGAVAFTGLLLRAVENESDIEVTAHRGSSAAAPENTMAAVRLALEEGTDWVEIDVQETADGEVVVMHDSDFKKISGSPLKIWEATMEDLRDLDIGSWFDPSFSGERVATLREVLETCRGRAGVNIELKSYGHGVRLEERVVEIVEDLGMSSEVVVMSLKYEAVQKMHALRPDWTLGLLTTVSLTDLTTLDADFLAVNASLATGPFVRSAHRAGKRVHTWTINDPMMMSAMMSRGVDNLITDLPALAIEIRRQRAAMDPLERLIVTAAALVGMKSRRPAEGEDPSADA